MYRLYILKLDLKIVFLKAGSNVFHVADYHLYM